MRELRLIHILLDIGLLAICWQHYAAASAGANYELELKEEHEVQLPAYSALNVQPALAFEFRRSLVRGRRYIASSFQELHQGTRRHVTKPHKKIVTSGRSVGKAHKKPAHKLKPLNFTVEKPLKKLKLSSDIPSQTQPTHTFLQFIVRPTASGRARRVSLSVPDSLLAEAKGLEIVDEKGHANKTHHASSFFLPMDTDFFKGVLSGQRKRSHFNDTQHASEMTIVNIEILEVPRNGKSPKRIFHSVGSSSENASQPAESTESLQNETKELETAVGNAISNAFTRSSRSGPRSYSSADLSDEFKPKGTAHGTVQKAEIGIVHRLTTSVTTISDGKPTSTTVDIEDLLRLIVHGSSNNQEKPKDKERKLSSDNVPVHKRKMAPVWNIDSSNEDASTPPTKEEQETTIAKDTGERDISHLPPISSDVLVISSHSAFTCFYSTLPGLKTTETTQESGDQTKTTSGDIFSPRETIEVSSGPPSEVTGVEPNRQEQESNATERATRRIRTPTTTPTTTPTESSGTTIPQTDSDSLFSVISMIGSYAVAAMIQSAKTEGYMHGNETEGSGTSSDGQTLPESDETATTSGTTTSQSRSVHAGKFKKHLAENNLENITSPTPVIYVMTGVTDANSSSPQYQTGQSIKSSRKRRTTMAFNPFKDKEEEQIGTVTEKTVISKTEMMYILSHLDKPLQSVQNCNLSLGDLCATSDSQPEQADDVAESSGNGHSVPFQASRSIRGSHAHDESSGDAPATLQDIHNGSSSSSEDTSEDRTTTPTVENHDYFSSTPTTVSDDESSNSVASNEGHAGDVSNETDIEKLQKELELRNLFENVQTAMEPPPQSETGFKQISALHNLIHEFVMKILEFLKKTREQETPSQNVTAAKSRSLTRKPDTDSSNSTVDESTKPKKSHGRQRTVKFLGFIHTSSSSTSSTCHPKTAGKL